MIQYQRQGNSDGKNKRVDGLPVFEQLFIPILTRLRLMGEWCEGVGAISSVG